MMPKHECSMSHDWLYLSPITHKYQTCRAAVDDRRRLLVFPPGRVFVVLAGTGSLMPVDRMLHRDDYNNAIADGLLTDHAELPGQIRLV